MPKVELWLGIREALLSNSTLLGKLVWNLIHDHDKFWVQMMLAKYIPNGDILSHQPSQGASFTWRSIMKAVSVLRDGYKFRIGEGDMSFWFDKWMDEGPMCSKVNYVHISDSQLKVKDVFLMVFGTLGISILCFWKTSDIIFTTR